MADLRDDSAGYRALALATRVSIHTIDSRRYALVPSIFDNGVQVIDITDPTMPSPAGFAFHNVDGMTRLENTEDITAVTIGGKHYALATSGDRALSTSVHGLQIMELKTATVSTPLPEPNISSLGDTGSVTDGTGGFTVLGGAAGVAAHTIGGNHYAVVTGYDDDAVTFINVTTPGSPTLSATAVDSTTTTTSIFDELEGPLGITTRTVVDGVTTKHYAIVAGHDDDGVQVVEFTDLPTLTAPDSVDGGDSDFDYLTGTYDVTTLESNVKGDDALLIVVTGEDDDGVTFVDMTDPTSLEWAGDASDQDIDYPAVAFSELDGPRGLAILSIGSTDFALVAAYEDDGLQLMDLFDGEARAVASPNDPDCVVPGETDTGCFEVLEGAHDVATFSIGAFHFAAVTAHEEDGVVIYDVTNPYEPMKTAQVTDEMDGFTELYGPKGIASHEINGSRFLVVTVLRRRRRAGDQRHRPVEPHAGWRRHRRRGRLRRPRRGRGRGHHHHSQPALRHGGRRG